jgi:DNA helicase-2/ATP-dependent DNA helicase PcrA
LLDDWEQKQIYDLELAASIKCTPSRAEEIRLAHDAQWQTLNPQSINQAQVTQAEMRGFNSFHAARTNLYSCVLPGEVIFKCVDAMRQGALQPQSLPPIDHLIVDEYQDLNACDQEFIRLLSQGNTVLFVAGDDDQSIYSFRHANPDGIVQFHVTYPQSTTRSLTDCFRCAPAVLGAASSLIQYNPNRISKTLNSLYANAAPPVQGQVHVWQFTTPQQVRDFAADHLFLGQRSYVVDAEFGGNVSVQIALSMGQAGVFGFFFQPIFGKELLADVTMRKEPLIE